MIVKIYNWTKKIVAILGCSLIGLMLSIATYAANPEPAVVNVEFVAPITITNTADLEFGLLDTGMLVSETVVIATNNGVTDAAGRVVGGLPLTAATFDTQAPVGKAITIQVTTPVSGAFYTLGTWTCDYDGGTIGDCLAGISETSAAATRVVRVGVTLTGLGGATAGVVDGSFDLTITYD